MRIIKLTVFIAVLLLSVNACCTRKDCGNLDEYLKDIRFYNFVEGELDTIIIVSYLNASNPSTKIDSSITQVYFEGDYYVARLNTQINTNLDYLINLPSTGQLFTLTEFEIERDGCNTCFPYRPKSDYFNVLKEYQINGQKQSGQIIKIYK